MFCPRPRRRTVPALRNGAPLRLGGRHLPAPSSVAPRAGRSWTLLVASALLGAVTVTEVSAQEPTVSLSLSRTSIAEDAGSTDVTVTATLSSARTSATTVTLSLGGTTRSTDYSVVGSLPAITILASQTSGTGTLVLSPIDDNFFEGDETIEVNGTADGALTVIGASLTLADTEQQPMLRLPETTRLGIVTEGSQTESAVELLVSVRLVGAVLEDDLTVRLAPDGSSTASTDDYDAVPSLPHDATIRAGESSVVVRLTITVVDDEEEELGENLVLVATTPVAPLTLRSNTAHIHIADDDRVFVPPPRVAVSTVGGTLSMGTASPSRDQTVRVRGHDLTETVTVTVAPPVAIAGWFEPATLTFTVPPAGDVQTDTFTITPVADDQVAAGRSYYRVSTSPSTELLAFPPAIDAYSSSEAPAIARALRFNGARGSTPNSTLQPGAVVIFRVSFDRPFELTTGTLRFELDSGSVEAPCRIVGSTRLDCEYRVAAGDYDFDRVVDFSAGALRFTWRDPDTGGTWPVPQIPPAAVPLHINLPIIGGDHGVELSVNPESIQEGTGATSLDISGVVTGARPLGTSVDVALMFTNETADAADYVVSGMQTITIQAGQIEGRATVTVTAVDDLVKENRIETVRIEGVMHESIFARGVDLQIIDAPNIVLSVSRDSVAENGGAQSVTVTAALGDPTDSGAAAGDTR